MQLTIEIPENKVPFVMELLKNLKFLKIKTESTVDFRAKWAELSAVLPQTEPEITEEEIMNEIKTVRQNRRNRNSLTTQ